MSSRDRYSALRLGAVLGATALTLGGACVAQSGSLPPADELVRRNVFRGEARFPIGDARAFQYGTIHVDGPEGGMLYRFATTAEAVDWLVTAWGLETLPQDGTPAPASPEDAPGWWRSATEWPVIMRADSTYGGGAVRTVLLFRDPAESVVYWREHYRDSRGASRP